MSVQIQFVKIPVSEALSNYTHKKLEKLLHKYAWIINIEVFFKLENDTVGKNKICEIEISAPGPRIFGASKERNFETAVKHTISELGKQLEKRKLNIINH